MRQWGNEAVGLQGDGAVLPCAIALRAPKVRSGLGSPP